MATADVLIPSHPASFEPQKVATALPQTLIDSAKCERQAWDASKHLHFEPPARVFTMKELGLGAQGLSPVAVSDPFPLFTEDAVRQMRAEVFSKPVLDRCQVSSKFATHQIRGHVPKLAPFIYDAWNDPQLLAHVSQVAGIDLVPAMHYDIGHCNISINDGPEKPDVNMTPDDMSAFGWHFDSYPFVVVTMLSDCTDMIGGETALRTGNGDVMKVRGPSMGTAVVMQGRYIEHQALKAFGGRERIAMVTSLRPKSPFVKDETILDGVRKISDRSELYHQYAEYRLSVLEERVREQLRKIRSDWHAQRDFDVRGAEGFLSEQRTFLDSMYLELVGNGATADGK